jgi:hypothetical protein
MEHSQPTILLTSRTHVAFYVTAITDARSLLLLPSRAHVAFHVTVIMGARSLPCYCHHGRTWSSVLPPSRTRVAFNVTNITDARSVLESEENKTEPMVWLRNLKNRK